MTTLNNADGMDKTADLSPQESLSLADSYFVDEDYELAVDAYAAALALLDSNGDGAIMIRALSHRSGAFYQLKRFHEARDDAQAAVSCHPCPGLRPGEMELLYKRLGLACLELKEYKEAKQAVEQALQLATLNKRDTAKYQTYIQQCNDKLNDTSVAASSKPSASDTTTRAASGNPPTAVLSPAQRRPTMPKYQYYQNDKFMTIAILEPGVHENDLQVAFGPKKLTVALRKGGVNFTIVRGTLYERVDIDHCKVKVMTEKVLVKLRKVESHEWPELFGLAGEDDEEEATKQAPLEDSTQEVPTVDSSKTRPYSSHRDWDAIERNLEMQEKQEMPEGEEAMTKLFQEIYAKADEDTKRAMIKSYQTSGGTVLSTNWNEVANTDYEANRTAPKGMEWKNWEGDKLKQKESDE
jgi:suppressor of G2 allele of SKP1